MRLCFIGPAGSIHTQRWLAAFADRGHTVHLIVVPGDPAPALSGVTLHPLPAGRPKVRFFQWAAAVRRIAHDVAADVLHGHYLTRYGWLAAASLVRPLVLTAWGSDAYVDPARSAAARRVTAWALRRADLVTADAADLRDRLVALGARPQRVAVVQWGVDTAVFHPAADAAGLRARLGLPAGPVILSTRALTPLYNQHILVAALPAIRQVVPTAQLIIKYGVSDAAYLARVQGEVARLGLTDAVRFVEQTPYHELAAFYALGDVFVSLAASDSTPVSLLEAMACGAAPVVSDLPALAEWVVDGENGFRTPVADPAAVAAAVIHLLTDRSLRERIAAANEHLVAERASHAQEMARMEMLYRQLTAAAP